MSAGIGRKKKHAIDNIMSAAATGGSFSMNELKMALSGIDDIIMKTTGRFKGEKLGGRLETNIRAEVAKKEADKKDPKCKGGETIDQCSSRIAATALAAKEVAGGDEVSPDADAPQEVAGGGGDGYAPGTGPKYKKDGDKFKSLGDRIAEDKAAVATPALSTPSFKEFLKKAKEATTLEYDSRYAKGKKDDFEGQVRFQAMAQEFLGGVDNPATSLYYLNEMQKYAPFMVADPRPQPLGPQPKSVKYGYADLFRFMGYPFSEGMARIKENPFYHPIRYPIPDPTANDALLRMLSKNSLSLRDKLRTLVESSSKKVFRMDDPEAKEIAGLIHAILADRYDPDRILLPIPGQERPMANYRLNNIHRQLLNMQVAHQLYGPIGLADKGIVGIEIEEPPGAKAIARGGGRRKRKGSKGSKKSRSKSRRGSKKSRRSKSRRGSKKSRSKSHHASSPLSAKEV